jgi:hypothetical protein
MMADLTNEFAVGAELQKLRGTRRISRAGGIATREDKHVSFGVHGDARHLAKIEILRKPQKIRDGLVRDLRRLLREKGTGKKEP